MNVLALLFQYICVVPVHITPNPWLHVHITPNPCTTCTQSRAQHSEVHCTLLPPKGLTVQPHPRPPPPTCGCNAPCWILQSHPNRSCTYRKSQTCKAPRNLAENNESFMFRTSPPSGHGHLGCAPQYSLYPIWRTLEQAPFSPLPHAVDIESIGQLVICKVINIKSNI